MRFSQLPPWAQKQMLSRPSVAEKVGSEGSRGPKEAPGEGGVGGKTPAPLEGKWAEVCVWVCVWE